MKNNKAGPLTNEYSFLLYVFSWLFWVPSAIMFSKSDSVLELLKSPIFIALQTLGAAGPSIVAHIMLKLEKKNTEIKAIFNRYKQHLLILIILSILVFVRCRRLCILL